MRVYIMCTCAVTYTYTYIYDNGIIIFLTELLSPRAEDLRRKWHR